LDKRKKYLVL